MTTDPTDPLEAALRANRVLRERVAELERQLKRFGADGDPAAALGTGLSERKALLSEAERIAHMGSWVWDIVGDEVRWSDELFRILGYDPATDTASSEGFFARVHPDDRERVRARTARGIETGVSEQIDYRVLRPDGSVRHVTMDAALLFDAQARLQRAVGTVLDVTEAREAARALRKTAELLAEAQRIGKMGSFELDLEARQLGWSDEYYRIVDIDPGTPPSVAAYLERVHKDDRARIAAAVEHGRATGEVTPTRTRLVHRDGSVHHVDITPVAIKDGDGKLLAIRGTITDVTKLVRLEAQFHQSQKLEAVGQLAGGLAHDYNNLLAVILGNAELLLDTHKSPEIEEIVAAATAATALTSKLLTFSRKSVERPRIIRLADDLEETKHLLQRAVGDAIVVKLHHGDGAWSVRVDRGQVQQILLNLALNARDAMPEGGTLALATSMHHLQRHEAEQRDLAPGQYVKLRVSDDGTGMSEETRARVFEPFFTTKGLGRGTGLGLAMVFGAMRQCGGAVEVHSELTKGTTFELWFPRATSGRPARRSESSKPPPGRARVLLVDDNAAVANVTRQMLEAGNYVVRVALSPEEAIEMWAAEPADLLVSDVQMPGMSGVRLCARLRERSPNVPVLFITGHSIEGFDLDASPSATATLMKPFRKNELLAALDKLLQEA